MEGVFGEHFKRGAVRAAHALAKEQGLPSDASQVKEKAENLYHYEIEHLPQAAIWTVSAIDLNVATQKILPILTHGEYGGKDGLAKLLGIKTLGGGLTAGILFTVRSSSPEVAHKLDAWVGEHLFAPAERFVHGVLGIDSKKNSQWQDRVAAKEAEDRQQRLRQ